MNWFRLNQDPVLKVYVGDDLVSLCAQDLPSKIVDRIARFRAQQSETPSFNSELIVIDTPVRVSYQETGNSPEFTLPSGRYLELGVISDKIHTILAAPQRRYLNQAGAFQLLTQLSDEAKRHKWTERQRFCHFKDLQRLLSRESGYFYSRYVEFEKGRETLSLSLKRLEPPRLFPWTPAYGFLVNICWTNADYEESLRKSIRINQAGLQPVEAKSKTVEPVGQPAGYASPATSPGPGDSMVVAEPILIEAEGVGQAMTAAVVTSKNR